MENTGENLIRFNRRVYTFAYLLLIIVVTIISGVITMIMNKLEFEKKVKFIVEKLNNSMEDNAIKADSMVLRMLFEEYVAV